MYHLKDRTAHTTVFVTPNVEHWLEREISLLLNSIPFPFNNIFQCTICGVTKVSACHKTFWSLKIFLTTMLPLIKTYSLVDKTLSIILSIKDEYVWIQYEYRKIKTTESNKEVTYLDYFYNNCIESLSLYCFVLLHISYK